MAHLKPTPVQRFARASFGRKLMFGASLALFGLAVTLTPDAYREIVERRQLDWDHGEVLGKVTALNRMSGRNRCGSTAVIAYEVRGTRHQVRARGCGAAADGRLALGDEARVIYVRTDPSIAEATAIGVRTPRSSWTLFILGWLAVLAAVATAWFSLGRTSTPARRVTDQTAH